MALYSNDLNLTFSQEFPNSLREHRYRFVGAVAYTKERGIIVGAACNRATQAGVFGVHMIGPPHQLAQSTAVTVAGEVKLQVDGAIPANTRITAAADGRATIAASGDFCPGYTLEAAGNANEIVRALVKFPAVRLTF